MKRRQYWVWAKDINPIVVTAESAKNAIEQFIATNREVVGDYKIPVYASEIVFIEHYTVHVVPCMEYVNTLSEELDTKVALPVVSPEF